MRPETTLNCPCGATHDLTSYYEYMNEQIYQKIDEVLRHE